LGRLFVVVVVCILAVSLFFSSVLSVHANLSQPNIALDNILEVSPKAGAAIAAFFQFPFATNAVRAASCYWKAVPTHTRVSDISDQ
jgi:hypothetical protein